MDTKWRNEVAKEETVGIGRQAGVESKTWLEAPELEF